MIPRFFLASTLHNRNLLLLFSILFSHDYNSQVTIFGGFIGKEPIQLITYNFSDGDTRAIYCYDRYDTPIIVNGKNQANKLILIEQNEKGESKLEFENFNSKSIKIKGKWISHDKRKVYTIRLTKLKEFDPFDESTFEKLELLQTESTPDNYFKLLLSKSEANYVDVIGVRIYEKKSDRLIQEINLECQFEGLNNISVNDFDFDGVLDFSVFEASYSGPNTSSIYILRDPKSERYYESEIYGTSLEFDTEKKLIYEHNQCCAGSKHTNSTYKLVDKKMVLIESTCFVYDPDKESFVEEECE